MRSRSRSAISGRSADLANSRLSPISIDPSRRSEPPLPRSSVRLCPVSSSPSSLTDDDTHRISRSGSSAFSSLIHQEKKTGVSWRTLVSPYSTSSSLPLFESACTSSRLHPSAALIFDRHAAHARSLAHVPTSAPRLGAEVHPSFGAPVIAGATKKSGHLRRSPAGVDMHPHQQWKLRPLPAIEPPRLRLVVAIAATEVAEFYADQLVDQNDLLNVDGVVSSL